MREKWYAFVDDIDNESEKYKIYIGKSAFRSDYVEQT